MTAVVVEFDGTKLTGLACSVSCADAVRLGWTSAGRYSAPPSPAYAPTVVRDDSPAATARRRWALEVAA